MSEKRRNKNKKRAELDQLKELSEEELKRKISALENEIKQVEGIATLKPKNPVIFHCEISECNKTFSTIHGWKNHCWTKHKEPLKHLKPCEICGKQVFWYLDHMKSVHGQVSTKNCPVCLKAIPGNMKKHRQNCKTCRFCSYESPKKHRLLSHIENCQHSLKNRMKTSEIRRESGNEHLSESENMILSESENTVRSESENTFRNETDSTFRSELENTLSTELENTLSSESENMFRSGFKNVIPSKSANLIPSEYERTLSRTDSVDENPLVPNKSCSSLIFSEFTVSSISATSAVEMNHDTSEKNPSVSYQLSTNIPEIRNIPHSQDKSLENPPSGEAFLSNHLLPKKKYPHQDDSDYESELESLDGEIYTTERRETKDDLEKELEKCDLVESNKKDADNEVETDFKVYMKNKKNPKQKESKEIPKSVSGKVKGTFPDLKEKRTAEEYARMVPNFILPAFHQKYKPFVATWILDPVTVKHVKVDEHPRLFVDPTEPIYFTPDLMQDILNEYDSRNKHSGSGRKILIAACLEFLKFIEYKLTLNMGKYGPSVLSKLEPYHRGVRSFLDGKGAWFLSNRLAREALQSNKAISDLQNPARSREILEKYKKDLASCQRQEDIRLIIKYAQSGESPSDGDFTRMGRIIMIEAICCTGCRPVVLFRLTMGSYALKVPGYNPYQTRPGDSVLESENGGTRIFRRVNPNIPPASLACPHQTPETHYKCNDESCGLEYEPDGYNIFCDWDKTEGSYYLHLPHFLVFLIDCYLEIRKVKFRNRKDLQEGWLFHDETPVLVNSAASEFVFLDVSRLSERLGISVCAYDFRALLSSWALNN